MKKRKICIITPGHVASNPRLVKEADALYEEGYDVTVLYCDITPEVRPLDNTILNDSPWKYKKIKYETRLDYISKILLQKIAQTLTKIYKHNLELSSFAYSRMTFKLMKAALSEYADLYIAHYLPSLMAASKAAAKYNTKFSFDAEDFHIGEINESENNRYKIELTSYIESSLIPKCEYVTASSPLIAKAYAERYAVNPVTILNVFPVSNSPKFTEIINNNKYKRHSMYWFSQTIGSGRGLEEIVVAMSLMNTQIHLYLRGSTKSDPGFVAKLLNIAEEFKVRDRIHILSSAAPSEMTRLAANYDLGLSIEPGRDQNDNFCLGNKIFTYLLAGIPILMSRTPSQIQLAKELGNACVLVDLDDTKSVAKILDKIIMNESELNNMKKTAFKLAKERFNWDIEKKYFLNLVDEVFN